jgi:hypothetical protein
MALCSLSVHLYDGARRPLSAPGDRLITIRNGRAKTLRSGFFSGSIVRFSALPFDDGPDNHFQIIVSAKDHQQAGAFRRVAAGGSHDVHLMLVPKRPTVEFDYPTLSRLQAADPVLAAKLQADKLPQAYEQLLARESGLPLLCLCNGIEALRSLQSELETDLLQHIQQIELTPRPAGTAARRGIYRDRFFARVTPALRQTLTSQSAQSLLQPVTFDRDDNLKEIRYHEANVELTFHEENILEVDLDYYRDLGAHFFLEVIPNKLGSALGRSDAATDPRTAYALRWMAYRNASRNRDHFAPPVALGRG